MAFPLANMPLTDINPDLDLLERMRMGDAAAMCTLYQRHQGPLYRFAVLRCGSADTAADIVQDVFMALIEGRLAFDANRGARSSFLFSVTRNFMLKRDESQRRFVSTRVASATDDDDALTYSIMDSNSTPSEAMLADQWAEAARAAIYSKTVLGLRKRRPHSLLVGI